LDEFPNRTYSTSIVEIGPEVDVTPRQLSSKSGGEFMSKTDESGKDRPLNKSYRARAPIDDTDARMVQGLRGTAKVYCAWQSLGTRLWRYATRTFNFRL
jgi:putative peptide zinc metalloprotease protein